MININNNQINFKSNSTNYLKKKGDNMNNSTPVVLATTGAIVLSTALFGIKGAKKNLVNVLKKNGIELKDGIATVIASGEKYSGTIKRSVQHFGLRKEAVTYKNGIIKEKILYNLFGQEIEASFYNNGILAERVTFLSSLMSKHKAFSFDEFDKKGNLIKEGDGSTEEIKSFLEYLRNKYQ